MNANIQGDFQICISVALKTLFFWTYVISYLKGEEIVGTIYEEELQTIYEEELQKNKSKKFRIEKMIKKKVRKGDKLYVKWKGYNNSFNSWIDKKIQYK